MKELIRISAHVQAAIEARAPVVALETTLVSHGFPPGDGAEVAREAERRVREEGAIPATIGGKSRASASDGVPDRAPGSA